MLTIKNLPTIPISLQNINMVAYKWRAWATQGNKETSSTNYSLFKYMCLSTVLFPHGEFGLVGPICICPCINSHVEKTPQYLEKQIEDCFVLNFHVKSDQKFINMGCGHSDVFLARWCGEKSKKIVWMDGMETGAEPAKILTSIKRFWNAWVLPIASSEKSDISHRSRRDTNETRPEVFPFMENLLSLQWPSACCLEISPARSVYLFMVSKLGWKRMEQT